MMRLRLLCGGHEKLDLERFHVFLIALCRHFRRGLVVIQQRQPLPLHTCTLYEYTFYRGVTLSTDTRSLLHLATTLFTNGKPPCFPSSMLMMAARLARKSSSCFEEKNEICILNNIYIYIDPVERFSKYICRVSPSARATRLTSNFVSILMPHFSEFQIAEGCRGRLRYWYEASSKNTAT
jgi:hypothetical protein